MFGRHVRSKLPSIPSFSNSDEAMRDRDAMEKEKGKTYADNRRKAGNTDIKVGDTVLVKRMRKEN